MRAAFLTLGLLLTLGSSVHAQQYGPVQIIPITKVRVHYNNPAENGNGKTCGVYLYGEFPVFKNRTNHNSYTLVTPGLQNPHGGFGSVAPAPGGTFSFYCYFNGVATPFNDTPCPDTIGEHLPDWHAEIRPRGPVASFTATAVPTVPGLLDFRSTSTEPEGDTLFEHWIFDDGSTSGARSVNHQYELPGNYPVSLTVTDSDGLTNRTSRAIVVPPPTLSITLRIFSKHENARIEPEEVFRVQATVSSGTDGVGNLLNVIFDGPPLAVPTNLSVVEVPSSTIIGTLEPGQQKIFEWMLRGEQLGDFDLLTAPLKGLDAIDRPVAANRATAAGTVTALIAGIEQRPARIVLGEDNNGDGVVNAADARVELVLGITNVTSVQITELRTDNVAEPISLVTELAGVPVAFTPESIFSGDLGSVQPGAANALFRTNIYTATNYVYATASTIVRGQAQGVPVQTGASATVEVRNPGVKITMHALEKSGLSPESITEGKSEGLIDAPLRPVTSATALAGHPTVSGGLIGDGVTPLLFALEGDIQALAIQNDELKLKLVTSVTSGGKLEGDDLQGRLRVLKEGAWVVSDTITLTQSEPIAYLYLTPIGSDEIELSNARELRAELRVEAEDTGTLIEEFEFRIAKPPITLIHGYNTKGQWGNGFKAILERSRPVVHTITYGQGSLATDSGPLGVLQGGTGAMKSNTLFPLDSLVPMLLGTLESELAPFKAEWAFTRHDVVAHSQGGLLSRMLSSRHDNPGFAQPFRNEKNHFRGRFHRVVTIGSPHNGTRLVRYLLTLNRSGFAGIDVVLGAAGLGGSLPRALAQVTVLGEINQDKFDPWGEQIQKLNDRSPSAPWQPDPDAKFHLVKTTVNGGSPPSPTGASIAEKALGLDEDLIGKIVLPHGSDGVVDLDSMGVAGPNVFRLPSEINVSHAQLGTSIGPIFFDIFGGTHGGQVNATAVAEHVIGALDQNPAMPVGNRQFGPFVVPTLLSQQVRGAVDLAAKYKLNSLTTPLDLSEIRAQPAVPAGTVSTQDEGDETFTLTLAPSPNWAVGSEGVYWFAEVFGTNGVSMKGLTLTPVAGDPLRTTLAVAPGTLGDVVAYAFYLSPTGTTVYSKPLRVASFEPASPADELIVLPQETPVPVGLTVRPQFYVHHEDGLWLERFVEADEIAVSGSAPSIVDVSEPLAWRSLSSGEATVMVAWRHLTATNQITVFGQPPGVLPVSDPLVWLRADAGLSLTNGTNVLSWTDQSGNGFVFSPPTVATRPLWMPGTDGRPAAVRFSGSPYLLGNLGRTLTNSTIFTLARFLDTGGGNRWIYSFGTRNFSGLQMTLARRHSDGAFHFDGAASWLADNTVLGTNYFVFSQVFGEGSPDEHRLMVNAKKVLENRTTVGRAYSAVATNVNLGRYPGLGGFGGELMEWVVYDRVLNVQERFEVEEYLRQRAGLAPFVNAGSFDLSSWESRAYDAGAPSNTVWKLDLNGSGASPANATSPTMLVAPHSISHPVLRAQVGSDGTSGFIGFVFGFENSGNFLLFDWNRTATNHPVLGLAPAGMRLRAFHVPDGGEPTAADFWASANPAHVTLLATNATPWTPGKLYDLTLRLVENGSEFTVSDGTNTLAAWLLPPMPGIPGQVGFFANHAAGARFGGFRLPGAAPVLMGTSTDGEFLNLNWINGEPPFIIEGTADLATEDWYEYSAATPNFTDRIPVDGANLFLRVRSSGPTPPED